MTSHLVRNAFSVVNAPSGSTDNDLAPSSRAQICLVVVRMRETAAKLLGNVLSGDPYWDAILDLYLAEAQERSVYQSAIHIRELSQPSAHRLSCRLEQMGAVVRTQDRLDCRRRNLVLTDRVRHAVDEVMDLMARNFCR